MLAHPSRSVADTREQLAELGSKADVILLSAKSEGDAADRALIEAGWDLAELARSYRRFVDTFTPVRESLASRSAPPAETAFVIRTLLIHEYRKIHLRDPLLPHSLLPADWIGAHAYELCRSLYRAVFFAADQFVSDRCGDACRQARAALAADLSALRRHRRGQRDRPMSRRYLTGSGTSEKIASTSAWMRAPLARSTSLRVRCGASRLRKSYM